MTGADPLAGARPLHTRTLDVEVRAAPEAPELWEVRAELVDLRKGGFVPIAADLQTAGLLHHMRVSARFDPGSGVLLAVAAEQPRVAFEASALSEGESCRDPVARLAALSGTRPSQDFERALRDAIGGPRGCSHVLVLARLAGATLAWLAGSRGGSGAPGWRPGERVFHRSLCFDGYEQGDAELAVDFQLVDLRCAPAPAVARPMDRVASRTELRGHALLHRSDLSLRALRAGLRERGPRDAGGDAAGWRALGAPAALVGASLARGFRRRVRDALPGEAAGAPVAAALLDLAPASHQCVASDCGHWPARTAGDPSVVVSGGLPDSCWMWRADGALSRALSRERREGGGEESGA